MGTTDREREFRVWAAILDFEVYGFPTKRVGAKSIRLLTKQIVEANGRRSERTMDLVGAKWMLEGAMSYFSNQKDDDGYHSFQSGGIVSSGSYNWPCSTTRAAIFGLRLAGGGFVMAFRSWEGDGKSIGNGVTKRSWKESKGGIDEQGDSMGMMRRAAEERFFNDYFYPLNSVCDAVLGTMLWDDNAAAFARKVVDDGEDAKPFSDYIEENDGCDVLVEAMRSHPVRAKSLCAYIVRHSIVLAK